MDKPSEIRGLMITVTNGRVLLPNANVTEIITFSTPEAIENAPNWLLGRTRWRGWRVPLVSFSILAGLSDREGGKNAKVTVLKALGGNPKMPFLAMVAQGFPRLTTISNETLIITGEDDARAPGVAHAVMIRDDYAIVPDLVGIERLISDAIAA
ncbi:MAG TPA: chemotaxis protein CheW [Pseudomonadota bacterium]|nr:chemotaxis protein CheW [Xanthomonadales bacterium]HQW80404.1 chemotaxis protein CheW [Pseudomonadota bacterium]